MVNKLIRMAAAFEWGRCYALVSVFSEDYSVTLSVAWRSVLSGVSSGDNETLSQTLILANQWIFCIPVIEDIGKTQASN